MTERLHSVAIVHATKGSHQELRDKIAESGSISMEVVTGFLTTAGRFVTRREAIPIAIAAGQLPETWALLARPLLSSDVNWEGGA